MPEHPPPKPRVHPLHAAPSLPARPVLHPAVSYCDLHVTSNFTFLTGASHPDELVRRAATLGHAAAAITDCNTLAGIVRAHVAARECGIGLAVGSRIEVRPIEATPPLSLLLFPTDRASYGRLSRLLTLGKRRAPKGECHLSLHDVVEYGEGMQAVVLPPPALDDRFIEVLEGLRLHFSKDDRLSLAACREFGADDEDRLRQLGDLAAHVRVPLVATNDILYDAPDRRALQDVLTCIRHGCTLEQAGRLLRPHAERCMKPPEEMLRLFSSQPWAARAVARSAEIASRAVVFNLDQLRYEYPDEVIPKNTTAMQHLTELTWQGARGRYPGGVPPKVSSQILHELKLIDELKYAHYFLTVHDIVTHARSLIGPDGYPILCQGRGAAANSAVCYCLGVTSVDPDRIDVLFERFVSKERNEPPDIDIDFEHERREEVIQYIYGKYGRDRAALTAEVISYRGRSAVREVGKALGLSLDLVDRLAKSMDWWENGAVREDRLREHGLNPADPTLRHVLGLCAQIRGFPRHLSQHVGGFVITKGPLCESVPIENAAMEERTIIEWDKDDIEALGMLKIDVLGLGMLTCIRKAFALIERYTERSHGQAHGQGAPAGQFARGVAGRSGDDVLGAGADQGGPALAGRDRTADTGGETPGCDRAWSPAAEQGGGDRGVRGGRERGGVDAGETPQRDRERRDRRENGRAFVHRGADRSCGGVDPFTDQDDGLNDGLSRPEGAPGCSHGWSGAALGPAEPVEISALNGRPGGAEEAPCDTESPSPLRGEERSAPSSTGSARPPGGARSTRGYSPAPLRGGQRFELHTIPAEDQRVYDMICKADTVGVFQIESRAQMSMLPRLKPRSFYDLVIEVAIVRPGPIQGNMVHPYLRRRNNEEPITYPSPEVEKVLKKTLGVPLFQEQAMSLAIVAAGFTPGEADQLRRAIAAWKSKPGAILAFGEKLMSGMIARGYDPEFAQRCFDQIKGFSGYGFPESHAASFALLVYVSSWLKCHHPAAFAAALLNSQPMGFYAPAQIVRDAKEHGVEVREIDVNLSGYDCSLEEGAGGPALRLGMRLINGLNEAEARAIAAAICEWGAFRTIDSLWRATGVRVATLRALARADAFRSMGLDRQRALWHIRDLRDEVLPMFEPEVLGASVPGCPDASLPANPPVPLPPIPPDRQVVYDYASIGLSLKAHPISFIRDRLAALRVTQNAQLRDEALQPAGSPISVAGIVLVRQRPSTASGVVFATIEDETGVANLIIRPQVYDKYRKAAKHAVVLIARGFVERQGDVVHIMVRSLEDAGDLLRGLDAESRDFH